MSFLTKLKQVLGPAQKELVPKSNSSYNKNLEYFTDNLDEHNGEGTLLVADILGFDTLGEKFQLTNIFAKYLKLNSQVIHYLEQNGILVTGNLRHGLECFFGWWAYKADSPSFHAKEALQCAEHLQQINSILIKEAAEKDEPTFFLRIGLHTDFYHVCKVRNHPSRMLGVVSSGRQTCYTLMRACNTNAIIYSEASHRHLKQSKVDLSHDNVRKVRYIGLSEPITAFDRDPLAHNPELQELVLNAMKKVEGRRRESDRWDCELDASVKLNTNKGDCQILNLARGGLAIRSEENLSLQDFISARIAFTDPELEQKYERLSLPVLRCEIRWKRQEPRMFMYGLKYTNLQESEREQLLNFLLKNLSTAKYL